MSMLMQSFLVLVIAWIIAKLVFFLFCHAVCGFCPTRYYCKRLICCTKLRCSQNKSNNFIYFSMCLPLSLDFISNEKSIDRRKRTQKYHFEMWMQFYTWIYSLSIHGVRCGHVYSIETVTWAPCWPLLNGKTLNLRMAILNLSSGRKRLKSSYFQRFFHRFMISFSPTTTEHFRILAGRNVSLF